MTHPALAPAHTTDPAHDPRVPLEVRQRLRPPGFLGVVVSALVTVAAGATFVVTVTELADLPGDPVWVPLLAFASCCVTLLGLVVTGALLADATSPTRGILSEEVRRLSPSSDPGEPELGEVRLVWHGPERAVLHRDGVGTAEIVPDRPVTEPLWRTRLLAGPTRVQEGDAPGASASVRDSVRRWTLTMDTARLQPGRGPAPGGALHHGVRGRHDRTDDVFRLELDGRPALAVAGRVLDGQGRWWDRPPVSARDVREGREMTWWAPADLSDGAILFLVWSRVSACLLVTARDERDRAVRSVQSSVNGAL